MKISSASKKVLASALSAAMVVAFAPTVAFGAMGDKITVTVNANGGEGTTYTYETTQGASIDAPSLSKAGYPVTGFTWDDDNDASTAETDVTFSSGKITVPTITNSKDKRTAISLTAVYATPTVNKAVSYDPANKTMAVTVDSVTNAKSDAEYKLALKKDGNTLATKTFAKGKIATGKTEFSFVENPLSTEPLQIADTELTTGTYTAELSDDKGVVSTAKVELVTLTLDAGEGATFGNAAGAKQTANFIVAKNQALGVTAPTIYKDGKQVTPTAWLTDGEWAVDLSKGTISSDTKLTATTAVQNFGAVSYANRTLTFTLQNTDADAEYKVELAGPDGTVIATQYVAKNGTVAAFDFDAKAAAKANTVKTSVAEAAGDYVATMTKTVKGTAGAADVVTTSKAKATLTELKVLNNNTKVADTDTFSIVAAGDKYTVPAALTTAPEGKVFDKWTFNGADVASNAQVAYKVGEVNTLSAVYKDAAKTQLEAPTFVSATQDPTSKKWTITVSSPDAAVSKLFYGTVAGSENTEVSNGVIKDVVDATATISVVAKPVTGATTLTDSKALTISYLGADATKSAFTDLFVGTAAKGLEPYVGNTKTKWLNVDSIKAAYDAGVASYAGYTDEAVADVHAANAKSVYDAVKAYADEQLKAYENGALVVEGDKAYTIASKDLKAATDAVTKAADTLAKVKAPAAADYQTAVNDVIDATNTGLKKAVVAADKADVEAAAAVDAQITKLAADYAKVTAENYQAALDAAEAAEKAYAALTDEAKSLVADSAAIAKVQVAALTVKADEAQKAADAAKAEADKATADKEQAQKDAEAAKTAAAEAAQKLVAAQDKAAAASVEGKTVNVKASKKTKKTTKAYSYAVKTPASESGQIAATSKVSASKGLTVKGAKVTLKKGVKKGTYTAKVKVSYGDSSKTVKVVFKVK